MRALLEPASSIPTDRSDFNRPMANSKQELVFSNQRPNVFYSNGYGGGDFSKDLGAGFVIQGGDNSTSYMGTELIDFLKRPANGGG